jgi:hypothetical protein
MIRGAKVEHVLGLVIALEVDGSYPRFKALTIEALLDREKNVVPNSVLVNCAHELLAFSPARE